MATKLLFSNCRTEERERERKELFYEQAARKRAEIAPKTIAPRQSELWKLKK
jgi:hypothetical protein